MKILINGYYKFLPKKKATFSGPRNLLESFLSYLEKNGHSYTALVLMGKKENDQKVTSRRLIVDSGRSSWLILKLRLHTNSVSKAKNLSVPKLLNGPLEKITAVIAAEKPDLVFLNGMSITNWYLMKAASSLGIPVIVNHLGLWFKEIGAYGASPAGMSIMREMEKDMVRLSSRNIFLSKLSYRHLNRLLIRVPRKKIAFAPNPVDEIYFQKSKKHSSRTQNVKIGIVARWDPIKNHEAVLRLAKEVQKQGLPWEFYSVTTIHKGYPWYKDMEQEYSRYIKVLQPMVPAQLRKFYQDMDILILPSRFDVSPTVVMEAIMQHRTTLISSSVGLVDVYRDCGAADLVVNFKHPSTVISAIRKHAKKDPPARLYKYVKKNYRGEQVYRAYMKIARSLTTQP